MPTALAEPRTAATIADLLEQLGDVPASRVRLHPAPGTATENDLIAFESKHNKLAELVDGTLVEKPVGYEESLLASVLIQELGNFVRPRKLGWVTAPDAMMRVLKPQVRLPDVSFVARTSQREKRPRGAIVGLSPDLAIEVLSKSNTRREMDRKRREYFAGGTRLVWMVDPTPRTVAVYTNAESPDALLTESDTLDGGAVLPGFSLALKELFAVLDE